MKRRILLAVAVVLLLGIVALYAWPVTARPFDEVYAAVPAEQRDALTAYRSRHPARHLRVDGTDWEYVVAGTGEPTVVFLHGMTGAHDIWFQQMTDLSRDHRVLAVTYPAVDSLAGLEAGVLAVLDKEGIGRFAVVGSSLGGYLAQYLAGRHPDRITAAVFGNTFPPNDVIAQENRTIGTLLPYLPETLVLSTLRKSFVEKANPAAGNDPLTAAYLDEMGRGRATKAYVVARYRCVVDPFPQPKPTIPLQIIESHNDPLVAAGLREALRAAYPTAQVHTFPGAGHFPYLNRPDEYTQVVRALLGRV